VKDQLETLLPEMVCEGSLPLQTAQRDIAADWIAAYKKYFHTDVPLPSRVSFSSDARADEGAMSFPAWRADSSRPPMLVSFRLPL
jgi:hypothetical protein